MVNDQVENLRLKMDGMDHVPVSHTPDIDTRGSPFRGVLVHNQDERVGLL